MTDRPDDERGGGYSENLTRKLLTLGLGAYFLTEDTVRRYVKDAKLPRDVARGIGRREVDLAPARCEADRDRTSDRRLPDAALAGVEDGPRSHGGEDTPLAPLSPRARAARAPSAGRRGSG